MPDRDVFNRNVERGWQAASRRVYSGEDDDLTLPTLLRALGKWLKDGGCPGLPNITSIVESALTLRSPNGYRDAKRQLQLLSRTHSNSRTMAAAEAGRGLLLTREPAQLQVYRQRSPGRVEIARAIIVELAINQISPAERLATLVDGAGITFTLFNSRQQHARRLLADAPQTISLAQQVHDHPEGGRIKAPRAPMPKPAQEEISRMALTQ